MEITNQQESELLKTIDYRVNSGDNETVRYSTIQFVFFGKIEDKEIRDLSIGLHSSIFRNNLTKFYRDFCAEEQENDLKEIDARTAVITSVVEKIFNGTSNYTKYLETEAGKEYPNFVMLTISVYQSKLDKNAMGIETKDELMVFNKQKDSYISASFG